MRSGSEGKNAKGGVRGKNERYRREDGDGEENRIEKWSIWGRGAGSFTLDRMSLDGGGRRACGWGRLCIASEMTGRGVTICLYTRRAFMSKVMVMVFVKGVNNFLINQSKQISVLVLNSFMRVIIALNAAKTFL